MIAAAAVLAAALLPASVGVGIGGAPVCPPAAVQPGQSVSLGSIYVVNTGSGTEDITLRAAFPANGLPGKAFPASWVSFGYPKLLWVIGRSSVTLGPGQSAYIPATLTVPGDAKPGLYASDLLAGTMTKATGSGQAVFGAGAEKNLQFAVAPAPAPACTDPSVAKVPGAQYAPASQTASQGSGISGKKLIGWALLAFVALYVLSRARKRFGRKGKP